MSQATPGHVVIAEGGVTPKEVSVSKVAHHQLTWVSKVPAQLTITFSEKVFDGAQARKVQRNGNAYDVFGFTIPAGETITSGPVAQAAAEHRVHFYTVTRDDTGEEIDPTVFIDP